MAGPSATTTTTATGPAAPRPLLAAVGPMRQRLYGEEARLIGRYSSGPLVGPRPVAARLAPVLDMPGAAGLGANTLMPRSQGGGIGNELNRS